MVISMKDSMQMIINGYGIFTWASGNVYKGNYDADMRCGYG